MKKLFLQSSDNSLEKREAELVLRQEHMVAVQPLPEYQWWCVSLLIKLWYSDNALLQNVRQIKVLVNQFKADPTKPSNLKRGIYPSILLMLRYGTEPKRTVLQRLEYWFSPYCYEQDYDTRNNPIARNIVWHNSQPQFFIKKNPLLYVSNGEIEVKQYIAKTTKTSASKTELEHAYINRHDEFNSLPVGVQKAPIQLGIVPGAV